MFLSRVNITNHQDVAMERCSAVGSDVLYRFRLFLSSSETKFDNKQRKE